MKNFCIFIISYNRAENINTINLIEKAGYTGKWYILIEDQDPQKKRYYENYKEKRIIEFNKLKWRKKVDMGDNFSSNNTALLPRQALFNLARDLEIEYFLVLDDDYYSWEYRFDENLEYVYSEDSSGGYMMRDLDAFLEKWIDYYEKSGVEAQTLSQGGDFIGGNKNQLAQSIQIKRKAMNTWLLSPEREFQYLGRMNNDVNTYIRNQQLGKVMFMLNLVSISQGDTQGESGGLTTLYLERGTYTKSFYTIIYTPSCTKLTLMGDNYKRIHHKIRWRNAVPKIISEEHKR